MTRRMKGLGKMLVVDDDQKSRNILERILAPTDYEVEIVKSGEEAVKRLKRSEFNLVLTDLDMPGMDGLELLSYVKSRYPDVPVIMVSGVATEESRNEALEIGAVGLLSKPYTRDQLLVIISESLAKNKK